MLTPRSVVHRLLEWYAGNARDLPWRHTRDPYAIWISEVMLQQTQVRTVVPYWERWMRALPDLRRLAEAQPERVLKLWEGLGYYHRVRNLQRAAQKIMADHAGVFPTRPEAIQALPGIGPYTAGAVGSLAFNRPTAVVDGNVTRLLARLFGIRQRVDRLITKRRLLALAGGLVEAAAQQGKLRGGADGGDWRRRRVAEGPCGALNEALMELGALICTPRQPRCDRCPVRAECIGRAAGIAERLPRQARRAPTLARRTFVFVCVRQARWFVRQRPAGGVNAHLWELPTVEATAATSARAGARSLFGKSAGATVPLFTVRHTITRHRIRFEVHQVSLPVRSGAPKSDGAWLTPRQLEARAFAAAHRRILRRLLAPRADRASTSR